MPVQGKPVCGMLTVQQVKMVKESWRIFSRIDPALAGEVFYGRLFLVAPGTKKMFGSNRTEQYRKLSDMLSLVVSRLDRSQDVIGDIRALGERHRAYGVKDYHYKIVCDTMLWTLEKGLGHDWSDELKRAWTLCYELVTHAMRMRA